MNKAIVAASAVGAVAGLFLLKNMRGESAKSFTKKAAEAGKAEIELSNLVDQRAQSDAVRRFGQRMVRDHTRAAEQLKQIAQSQGVPLPNTLNEKHQQVRSKLSKLSGRDFDRKYILAMIKDHEKVVKLFSSYSENGDDEQLRSFASNTLPTLEQHRELAYEVAESEGFSTTKAAVVGKAEATLA